jgi:hypothetical protein
MSPEKHDYKIMINPYYRKLIYLLAVKDIVYIRYNNKQK